MLNVYETRPQHAEGRLAKEMRVYDALEALGIPFVRVDHAPAFTMEDCIPPQEALGAHICKNLFLCNRQKTAFYLLMMPADKPFHTKLLSAQIGSSRLSFASGEDMEALCDITPGSMSPFGLMNDKEGRIRLLVDEELLAEEALGVHPCINTSTLKIATRDLLERFVPSTGHHAEKVSFPRDEAENADAPLG